MTTITLTSASGEPLHLAIQDSELLGGQALVAVDYIIRGARFIPATAVDRDALVVMLAALDYTISEFEVTISGPDYTITATRRDTRKGTEVWAQREVAALSRRLRVRIQDITVTITEVTP